MAFTKPSFSVAIPVPNCNFQLPGDSGGLAAGWSQYAGMPGTTPVYSGVMTGSIVGRPRQQYIYIAAHSPAPADVGLQSAPSDPYHLTANAATKMFAVLDVVCAETGHTISLSLMWYTSAGALISSTAALVSVTSPTSGLTTSGAVSVTPPATAAYATMLVTIDPANNTAANIYLSFAGVGCWNGNTAGSFQPTRYPIHPGTTGEMAAASPGLYRSESGRVRMIDRTRNAMPNAVSLSFTVMPNSDMILFQKLQALNSGRNWDVATAAANPTGGSWPILLVPGNSGLVSAMLCDMTSMSFQPDAEWGRQDPPLWQAGLTFTERT